MEEAPPSNEGMSSSLSTSGFVGSVKHEKVQTTAERTASRVMGRVHEERRERELREAVVAAATKSRWTMLEMKCLPQGSRKKSKRLETSYALLVTVHRIYDFCDEAGLMDRTDPFVSLELGKQRYETTIKDDVGGHNVTFDETFTFHTVHQLPDKTLKVKVLDRDKLCDDLMGECDIHLDLMNLPGDAGKPVAFQTSCDVNEGVMSGSVLLSFCLQTHQVKAGTSRNPKRTNKAHHWHAKEVKESHKTLLKLTHADMELLASFERVPRSVEMVMMAVHEILEIPCGSWNDIKRMLYPESNSRIPFSSSPTKTDVNHDHFKSKLENLSSQNHWMRPEEKAAKYPQPTKAQKIPRVVEYAIAYSGHGSDAGNMLKMLKKYTSDHDFVPEKVGEYSKAAFALCAWVCAIELHFKELKRKPPREMLEDAIENGSSYLAPAKSKRIEEWLPMIASKSNKTLGSKSYDDLLQSKTRDPNRGFLVRKLFRQPPPKLNNQFQEAQDPCAREGFVRDIDISATYSHFKSDIQERMKSNKDLAAQEKPSLTALCKFQHPAFGSSSDHLRSWQRFSDLNQDEVRFEDGAPRPISVERTAKRAEQLSRMYKSDVLMRKMVKAIETSDQEAIRTLAQAGADFEWTDEKGRNFFEIAKEYKQMASLKALQNCKQRLKEARMEAHLRDSKTKPVVLPPVALPARCCTHHGKRRQPIKVITYRKKEVVIDDKYKLEDANEYVTESEKSSTSEEEEFDYEEHLRANTLRYMNKFHPPLTPPGCESNSKRVVKRALRSETATGLSVVSKMEGGDVEVIHQFDRTTSVASGGGDNIKRVPSDGVQREPIAEAEFRAPSCARNEDSGSTSLAGVETVLASEPQETSNIQDETQAHNYKHSNIEKHEVAMKNEERRTKKKYELFRIMQNGTMKGGIEDLATTSKEHQYMRKCLELQIMPRPLLFGQSDPEHINLKRFGLHAKNGEALALVLSGIENCKSLNLSENRLGAVGLNAICQALSDNKQLTSLDMSFNDIRRSIGELNNMLDQNKSITDLNLAGNEFSDKSLSQVLETLNDVGIIRSLNVSRNLCGSSSFKHLLALIHDSKISHLDVSWMGLRLPFMQSLRGILNLNKYLTMLNLSYNGLCDESAKVLAEILVDCVDDVQSRMALEHLDLSHNRIQKKGAVCLALALEKVAHILETKKTAHPFLLQKLVLNGNAIGEIGFRACFHALGCIDMEWEIFECLPDSAGGTDRRESECGECAFFERGAIEKSYELDLADFHDRLVADQLVQIAQTRFQGRRIIQSAFFRKDADDENREEIVLPDGQDHLFRLVSVFDWNEGILELVLEGPWSSFTCRFVGEGDDSGTYFQLINNEEGVDGEEENGSCASRLPEVTKISGKNVYFEFSDGAQSEMSRVRTYKQKIEMNGVLVRDLVVENSTEEQGVSEGIGGKVHVFRLQQRPKGVIKHLQLCIDGASAKVQSFHDTDQGFDVYVQDLTCIAADGSHMPPDSQLLERMSQEAHLSYSVLVISSLLHEEQIAEWKQTRETCLKDLAEAICSGDFERAKQLKAQRDELEVCKCWYIDSVPQAPMNDVALGKILKVLKQVSKKCGEDRVLALVRGISKDAVVSAEQANLIAQLFCIPGYRVKAFKMLCDAQEPFQSLKQKKKIIEPDDFREKNLFNTDPLALMMDLNIEKNHAADELMAKTTVHLDIQVSCSQSFVSFFDLFGDMMTLTRLDEEDSSCWNLHFLESQALNFARTALKRSEQTMSRGVAFGVRDKDAVLPNYCIKRVRFTFEKEPKGKVMKVDFEVLFVEPEEGIVLIQDQSISANDGSSSVYSLLELTEEGLNYNFEFPNNGQSDNLTASDEDGQNEDDPI